MTADQPTIRFAGRDLPAPAGASIAAALVAAGERVCRVTASGEPRGVFCGMGVCHDCIVTIDGAPGQRGCMTPARDGMAVEIQPALAPPGAAPADRPRRELAPDLLVVGGGPGGLTAAAVAAEAGLDVVLVDERAKPGGQYFKQPAVAAAPPDDLQFRRGRALIERVERAGVRALTGTTVWAAFARDEIMALAPEASYVIRPRRLVLATGAYETAVPLPGWTLPGCMTTGAAQTLLRAYGIAPGRRVLLSGNGPLNLQVAAELLRTGVEVVALAELAAAPGAGEAGALLAMLATAPDLVRDGLGYRRALRRRRVPVLHGHAVVGIEGDGRVEAATVQAVDAAGRPIAGTERRFAVDAVCLGFGFQPSNEIARTLGCRHEVDARRGQLVAVRDPSGRSSVEGVWIVGDSAGLGGARLAEAEGVLAGLDVARDLGRSVGPALAAEAHRAGRRRARNLRFQAALWRLYRAPRLVDQLATAHTPVCRCEGVTLAQVQAAIDAETESAGAIKRLTRAGMGRCQGRYCAPVIAALAARRSGRALDERSFFAPRVPFKPVPIAMIAGEPDE